MEKSKVLEIIDFVKGKRQDKVIHQKLNKVVDFVNNKEYTYNSLLQFIHDLKCTKLGIMDFQINRSLNFLKEEIKKHKRSERIRKNI